VGNGYSEDKNKIEDFITEQRKFNEHFSEKQEKILVEVITLKVKASLWGAVTALIVSPIISAIVAAIIIKLGK